MLFEDAFKKNLIADKIEGVLERTPRIYPCCHCNRLTGWRKLYPDCPGVPVCSDECKDVLDEEERTCREEASNTSVAASAA